MSCLVAPPRINFVPFRIFKGQTLALNSPKLQSSLQRGQSHNGPIHPDSHWQVKGSSEHDPCWQPARVWHLSQSSPVQPWSHLNLKMNQINSLYRKVARITTTCLEATKRFTDSLWKGNLMSIYSDLLRKTWFLN